MTQRTAERPAGMNLDWHSTSEDTWQADLPAIPGYTGADGNGSFVTVVYNGNTELAVPYDADCTIFLSQGGVVNLNLWDMWAFDPFGPDAKDVMQAVDELGVSDIADELKRMGYEPEEDGDDVVTSRRSTRRKAFMTLDWVRMGDDYGATLPTIPGYQGSYPNEVRVCSRPKDDDVWLFEMLIGVGDKQVPLYNYDFGIPYGGSADEMMDAVENLDPQDVASVLGDFGFAPGEDTTAGRHAMRRKANMNLDWEQDDVAGSWFADLPSIPGYPCAGGYSNHVQVADQSGLEGTDWAFYMYLELQKETVHLYNEDFDIPDTDTAEEMMNIVENLDSQEIADVLAAQGYEPVSDATASRKADKRTANLGLDDWWEKDYDSLYEAFLPAIPGYTEPDKFIDVVQVRRTGYEPDIWTFRLALHLGETVFLTNKDFGIPDGKTAKDMEQAADSLTVEDIADALQAEGYMPDED